LGAGDGVMGGGVGNRERIRQIFKAWWAKRKVIQAIRYFKNEQPDREEGAAERPGTSTMVVNLTGQISGMQSITRQRGKTKVRLKTLKSLGNTE